MRKEQKEHETQVMSALNDIYQFYSASSLVILVVCRA